MFGTVFEVGANYQIVSPIGQGAYGVVVAAREISNPKAENDANDDDEEQKMAGVEGEEEEEEQDDMVAIKKIVLANFTAGMIRRTLREIKILRLLEHENMLTLWTVLPPPSREEFKEIYMITNLMPTNLTSEIQKYTKAQDGKATAAEASGLTEKHIEYFIY